MKLVNWMSSYSIPLAAQVFVNLKTLVIDHYHQYMKSLKVLLNKQVAGI